MYINQATNNLLYSGDRVSSLKVEKKDGPENKVTLTWDLGDPVSVIMSAIDFSV